MAHKTAVAVKDLQTGDTLALAGQTVVRLEPEGDAIRVYMRTTTGFPVQPVWRADMVQVIWREDQV